MKCSIIAGALFLLATATALAEAPLEVGFGSADITPVIADKPVFIAGFGHNRRATGVADSLFARAVVLRHGKQSIALVAIDVVGFFHANVERVRKQLPGFEYVLVSSTHNHEGPDTLGLWGKSPFASGVDADYMKLLEERIVKAVKAAEAELRPATAAIASAFAPDLLHDSREPIVKHDELVAVRFTDVKTNKLAGVIVQWNCHPETLADKNTLISADFVGYTVKEIAAKQGCPVVYLTGTVGGLMSSLKVPVRDDKGNELKDGTFEKTERYGRLVGQLANKALDEAKPVQLTPIQVRRAEVFLPVDNKMYVLGRQLGVLKRDGYLWTGDATKAEPIGEANAAKKRICMKSEIGWLRLGQLDIAAIPGEIYPELVLDKVPDPAPEGADFPDAPIEPAIYKQLPGPHRMMIGLANDEIGYIIPKREWDEKPPFTYGRKTAPYGEINSLGPDTAPLLCEAFRRLVAGKK
jgi:hypothetical protein